MSLAELVVSARSGDQQALREIYSEVHPKLSSFARRRGCVDPDGTANTVLASGIRNIGTNNVPATNQVWAYLYRSVRNQAIDERRREHRSPRCTTIEVDVIDATAGDFVHSVATTALVMDLLNELTRREREVIEHRFFIDMTLEQTAAAIEAPIGSVKALQHRALKKLRVLAQDIGQ